MIAVGDKITFTPTAVHAENNGQDAPRIHNEKNRVTGVVITVNRAHRWFRVAYKPKYDREQHECFKY